MPSIFSKRDSRALITSIKASVRGAEKRLLYAGNILSFLENIRSNDLKQLETDADVRIVLMYPFALFARDRMAAEGQRAMQSDPTVNCGATLRWRQQHWIPAELTRAIQRLLIDHNFSVDSIRLTMQNPLCSTLICDSTVYMTPYHYGRTGRHAECTAKIMPVIKAHEKELVFPVLKDHVDYLWSQPTSFRLKECIENLHDPVNDLVFLPPRGLRLPTGVALTENNEGHWVDKELLAEQIVQRYSPLEVAIRKKGVFISHASENLEEANVVKGYIEKEFYAQAHILMEKHITGKALSRELRKQISECSHAIVLASKDTARGQEGPKPNVIHELGYCQALMGSDRVLVFKYPGVELPSNIAGDVYSNFTGSLNDLKQIRRWLENSRFIQRDCHNERAWNNDSS